MKITDKIIVIDLEATCWNGQIPKGQRSEIIEIGICVLDTTTWQISKSKGFLIRPERSKVSTFCTELTTITPKLLAEEGLSFADVCHQITMNYTAYQYTWASYGTYDLNMMKTQCQFRQVPYPLNAKHINVKTLFSETKGLQKKVGMKGALGILNFSLEGTHHRGVDDAKNIAKILAWCLQNR